MNNPIVLITGERILIPTNTNTANTNGTIPTILG